MIGPNSNSETHQSADRLHVYRIKNANNVCTRSLSVIVQGMAELQPKSITILSLAQNPQFRLKFFNYCLLKTLLRSCSIKLRISIQDLFMITKKQKLRNFNQDCRFWARLKIVTDFGCNSAIL